MEVKGSRGEKGMGKKARSEGKEREGRKGEIYKRLEKGN